MIRIDNLIKVVGAKTLFAIDHLTVKSYDRIALIGDNCSGKITFLRTLFNFDTEYAGRV